MPYLIIILAAGTEAKYKSPHTILSECIHGKTRSLITFASCKSPPLFNKLQTNHDATLSAGSTLDLASIVRFAVNGNIYGKAMVYPMASLSVPPRYGFVNTNSFRRCKCPTILLCCHVRWTNKWLIADSNAPPKAIKLHEQCA